MVGCGSLLQLEALGEAEEVGRCSFGDSDCSYAWA
jgi:hypothetical protein